MDFLGPTALSGLVGLHWLLVLNGKNAVYFFPVFSLECLLELTHNFCT